MREESKEIERKKKSLQIAAQQAQTATMSDPVPAKRAENPRPAARRALANQDESCGDEQPIKSKNEVSFAAVPQQAVNKNMVGLFYYLKINYVGTKCF